MSKLFLSSCRRLEIESKVIKIYIYLNIFLYLGNNLLLLKINSTVLGPGATLHGIFSVKECTLLKFDISLTDFISLLVD